MDPAVVTGATAVATGLIGYLGALLQHRAERDRIGIERDRFRLDQTRLENEAAAVHAKQLDEQRERRSALYLSYLEAAEEAWTLCIRSDVVRESDIDRWWHAYQGVRRQLQIGAAREVVDVASEMNQTLVVLFPELIDAVRQGDDVANYSARVDVWRNHGGTFDDVLTRLQGVMRADLEIGA